jgi:hypothetical protein
MIETVKELEETMNVNANLTFEEYKEIQEPSYIAVINDYAVKVMERAKDNGELITLEEAKEIAKKEIPLDFIPEWMRNLRVNSNIAGTTLIYLEALSSGLERIEEIMSVAFEPQIQDYIQRHSNDFKREGISDDKQ